MLNECPQCRSICTVPILYGKPGLEMERAVSYGLAVLGGCAIDDNAPNQHCKECGRDFVVWREFDPRTFLSSSVVLVQKHQDQLDHAISEYGAACVLLGQTQSDPNRSDEYRGAFQDMMRAHLEIGRIWQHLYVFAQEECSRNDPDRSATRYGYWERLS